MSKRALTFELTDRQEETLARLCQLSGRNAAVVLEARLHDFLDRAADDELVRGPRLVVIDRGRRRVSDDDFLGFIAGFTREHGYPPSTREICEGTGLSSTSTVHSRLKRLSREGRVLWSNGQVRTLTIVERDEGRP